MSRPHPNGNRRAPSRRRRGSLIGLTAAAAAAALVLSACSSGSSANDADGPAKTAITVAVAATAPTLDGVVGGGGITLESFELNANLQAGLVRNPYKKDGDVEVQDYNEYVPYLAKSYDVSDDGLVYTFHLRPELKSQVGNPITADDVIYSFDRKWNSPAYPKVSWTGFAGPSAIEKIDDHTVAFTLTSAGFGQTFLGLLANLQGHIYDSKLLQEHATKADPYSLEWAKTNSGWGLGPYQETSWTPDQQMVLTANENYALGAPEIKKVTLKVVADAGTRASLVASGAVDMAEGTRPADQAKLASNDAVTVPTVTNPIEYADLTLVTNKAPFDDETVRRAFGWAVPYEEIIEQIYEGRAKYQKGSINPSFENYSNEDLPGYSYDPEKSKELLEEAGVTTPVAFTLHVSTATQDLVDAAVLVKSYAEKAGFDVTIKQDTAADFGTGRSNASYQALFFRNRGQVQTPAYASTTFFKPGNDLSSPSRWSDESNTEYWKVVDEALAMQDQLSPEATELWQQAQTILLESNVEDFVAYIQPSQLYSSKISGYTYRSENAIDFANLSVKQG